MDEAGFAHKKVFGTTIRQRSEFRGQESEDLRQLAKQLPRA